MPEKSHGILVTLLIIIGIIIIILLLRPRAAGQYSYQESAFTASTAPIQYIRIVQDPQITKTYGHPITVYSYPSTRTTTYTYTTPNQPAYYPQGCTEYTTYSATTGYPCR